MDENYFIEKIIKDPFEITTHEIYSDWLKENYRNFESEVRLIFPIFDKRSAFHNTNFLTYTYRIFFSTNNEYSTKEVGTTIKNVICINKYNSSNKELLDIVIASILYINEINIFEGFASPSKLK